MLGLEAVSGMREDIEKGGRAISGRNCEQGMTIKNRFYGNAKSGSLY